MKIFTKRHDGGLDSGVTGYWLIECKSLFSIVLLRFLPSTKEAYHSHAFNAITWWIKGTATEEFPNKPSIIWKPSFRWKVTPKTNIHRYRVEKPAWAISIRGPWETYWKEVQENKTVVFTKHRQIVTEYDSTRGR